MCVIFFSLSIFFFLSSFSLLISLVNLRDIVCVCLRWLRWCYSVTLLKFLVPIFFCFFLFLVLFTFPHTHSLSRWFSFHHFSIEQKIYSKKRVDCNLLRFIFFFARFILFKLSFVDLYVIILCVFLFFSCFVPAFTLHNSTNLETKGRKWFFNEIAKAQSLTPS